MKTFKRISFVVCLSHILFLSPSSSQTIDPLKQNLNTADDFNKRKLLGQLLQLSYDQKDYLKTKSYSFQILQLYSHNCTDSVYSLAVKMFAREYYRIKKLDSAEYYSIAYLKCMEEIKNLKEIGWADNFLGIITKNRGQISNAIDYYSHSISIRDSIGDLDGMSGSLNNLGIIYQESGDYRKAKECFEKSLAIREKLKVSPDRLANAYINVGEMNLKMGAYDIATKNYFNALRLYEQDSSIWGTAASLNNIGIIYYQQKDYEQAITYFQKSLVLATNNKLDDLLPNIYLNFANVYAAKGEKVKNIEYLSKGLEITQAASNTSGTADFMTNLGINYADYGNYPLALKNLLQARCIYENIESSVDIANIDIELGRLNVLIKNYSAAIPFLTKGLKVSKDQNSIPLQEAAENQLSLAYKGLGKYDLAYQHQIKYAALKDSIDNIEKTKEITLIQSKYDQEKNESEIQRLNTDRISKELEISEQKRTQNKILGTSLLFLLTLTGLYLGLRVRNNQKQIQFEKEKSQKLLQIDQLKDQFLANTSHELKTPLNGIIGLSESLIDGISGELPVETINNLKLISSSGKRLASLVNDILDFSKAKNKDLILNIKSVDPAVVADLVMRSSSVLIGSRPINLENKVPVDLPFIAADENRLQQILFNLIGNAIKFTDKGNISLEAEEKNDLVEFRISDTGIGIPNNKFETIFKSFEQLDGTETRTHGGAGLGLAVTKLLVELHHGTINLESKVNEGTTFSFTIPIFSENISTESKTQREPVNNAFTPSKPLQDSSQIALIQPTLKTPYLESFKILIVDDEVLNLKVLENHLLLSGYQVEKAFTGTEALEKIKSNRFDLVIVDVMMPNMTGFELCRRIRETHLMNKLPLIMLTAKNSITDLLKGFESGINDYLTKPFSKDELLSRLRTHLRLKNFYVAADKFVPIEFLKALGRESITEAKIGDFTADRFTIMFSDIRDSTTLAEQFTPEDNFKFINGFVGRMGPLIRNNHGFVNQYLGDAIMSIFPTNANDALNAAIQMQQTMHAYNEERIQKGRLKVEIGVGLHTGDLIMGIIGDDDRADPATLADTVNVASRIEGLTKYFGSKILISEDTYNLLENPEQYHFRSLGKIQLKGKTKVLTMYECLEGENDEMKELKLRYLDKFRAGIINYQNGEFDQSKIKFEKITLSMANDIASQYFLRKSIQLNEIRDIEWSGIEVMVEK